MSLPVPSQSTPAVLQKLTVALWDDDVRDALTFAIDPPRVSCTQSTSVASGATTLITWTAETYDTDTMHSLVTNTSRLIATKTGLYTVNVAVNYPSNGVGVRLMHIRKNSGGDTGLATGTLVYQDFIPALAANDNGQSVSLDVPMTATDYIEVFTSQTSGSTLALTARTYAQMRWVAIG